MRKGQKALLVYLNDQTNETLNELQIKTRLSKSDIIRFLILGYRPPEGPPVNYDELIFQLRAIGNNINQLLCIARRRGILNPNELENHLTELRRLEKKMDAVFEIKRNN